MILLEYRVESAHSEPPRPLPADLAVLPASRISCDCLLPRILAFDALMSLRGNRGAHDGTARAGMYPTETAMAEFGRCDCVAVLGKRPYAEAPICSRRPDVRVVSFFIEHPFFRGANPNRGYRDLVAGIPVTPTSLHCLPHSASNLQIASYSAWFAVAKATAQHTVRCAERRKALARTHDRDRA